MPIAAPTSAPKLPGAKAATASTAAIANAAAAPRAEARGAHPASAAPVPIGTSAATVASSSLPIP